MMICVCRINTKNMNKKRRHFVYEEYEKKQLFTLLANSIKEHAITISKEEK